MSDRYEIRAKIGVGGMGAVYRAYDKHLRREVALKRLLPQDQKPEEARKTAEFLIQEAGVLSKLQHPNIVSVYDCGIDDDGGYVVMELISGETLNETIKRGALPLKDFNSVVEQALEGLIAAQQVGMLHRDIKPTNVMIRWFPSGSFQLKLLDFGLAKVSTQPSLQTVDHKNSILGSIYFMSPEQFEREPLDGRSDLYSLGCLLYYCLAGRFPFRGKSAPDVMAAHLEHDVSPLQPVRPDIPAPICEWVLRMMSRNREDRPEDGKSALREYTAILASLSKKSPGSGSASPPTKPSTHPRLIVGVSAPSLDTGSQRVSTAAVLRPLHRTNKKRGWILSLSAAAAFALAASAYLIWVPKGDSNTGSKPVLPPRDSLPSSDARFPLPAERPDRDLATLLFPFGSEWKFAPPGDVPADRWIAFDFDDSSWKSGPSPIGYGDKGLATALDVAAFGNSRPLSLYYRARFDLPAQPPEGTHADLQLIADDGALVYLNGTEVARIGIRAGDLNAKSHAVRRMETETEGWLTRVRFPTSLLRKNSNILAVRVMQINASSSDSWLDLKLGLCKPGTPPSPNSLLARADGLKEIVPTSENTPREWRFTTKEQPPGWENSALDGETAKGRPASPSFAGKAVRIPWTAENIWMTQTFRLDKSDLDQRKTLALKVLHTGNITVYINGRLAAERLGENGRYVALPIHSKALGSLKQGENRLSVHSSGGKKRQAADVGIVRLENHTSL